MIKSFAKGASFGFGFTLAVIVAFYAWSKLTPSLPNVTTSSSWDNEWNQLSIDDRLKKSSAVAVIRFKPEEDGLNAGYVESIHKKKPSVLLAIEEGDRMESFDFYSAGGNGVDRNGEVIYYEGSPAKERKGGGYLYDDRLIGAKNMPLEIFLRKFESLK